MVLLMSDLWIGQAEGQSAGHCREQARASKQEQARASKSKQAGWSKQEQAGASKQVQAGASKNKSSRAEAQGKWDGARGRGMIHFRKNKRQPTANNKVVRRFCLTLPSESRHIYSIKRRRSVGKGDAAKFNRLQDGLIVALTGIGFHHALRQGLVQLPRYHRIDHLCVLNGGGSLNKLAA